MDSFDLKKISSDTFNFSEPCPTSGDLIEIQTRLFAVSDKGRHVTNWSFGNTCDLLFDYALLRVWDNGHFAASDFKGTDRDIEIQKFIKWFEQILRILPFNQIQLNIFCLYSQDKIHFLSVFNALMREA